MATQDSHPQVAYDALPEPPASPHLAAPQPPYAGGPGTPSPGASPHLAPTLTPLPNNEFGQPQPGYFDSTLHTSSVASSANLSATPGVRASNYGSIAPLARDSSYGPAADSGLRGSPADGSGTDALKEKDQLYEAPRNKRRKKLFWVIGGVVILVLLIAIVVPVAVLVGKSKSGGDDSSDSDSSGSGNGNDNGNDNDGDGVTSDGDQQPTYETWGGDGSRIMKADGTSFVYNNSFGGYWVYDPVNPLNNSARAQSYTPPLSEEWPWGEQRMYGVNLGGWLNLEPFISPAMYEPFFPNAVDEWTLCEQLRARDGNLDALEEHYRTFITEEDFAQIAAAGLNWIRIPIGFWAIETYPGEPFLEGVSWQYFLKAIEWARKYGLRINLDLHATPGSQNGWNHSGKLGETDMLNGVMGVANAQRTMDYIRILAEFISQPEIQPVVPFFGILNEPRGGTVPLQALQEFYAEAYRVLRQAGNGYGAGNGPYMSIHDGFLGSDQWTGFLSGADRLAFDVHPYLVFGTVDASPPEAYAQRACDQWGGLVSTSMSQFGLTSAGEWSNAINDCGLYVNAVGEGTRYEGTFNGNPRIGDCEEWMDYSTWTPAIREAIRNVNAASIDALGNFFFWTWRIGESLETGTVRAPFWSYKLGLQEGWVVTDPRAAEGFCATLGSSGYTFVPPLQPHQRGADPDPVAAGLEGYAWPPTTVGGFEGAAASLPTYTRTGPIPTLPVPTFSAAADMPTATVAMGNGWNNPDDQELMAVPIPGCDYPDPWAAVGAAPVVC